MEPAVENDLHAAVQDQPLMEANHVAGPVLAPPEAEGKKGNLIKCNFNN